MSFYSLAATTSRIWNETEGGKIFDDSRINRILVRDKVLVERAEALATIYTRYPGEIPSIYYNRCCFDITCTPLCDSPVVETTGQVPGLLGMLGKRGIKYLGSVDGKHPYEWKQTAQTLDSYLPISKAKNDPYFNIYGTQAVITNAPNGTAKLLIIAILADPFACGCIDEEEAIFIPADHIGAIEKKVKYDIAQMLLQKQIDRKSDTNPDV